jgi:hypothetical protein
MSEIIFIDKDKDDELYEHYENEITRIGAATLCYSQIPNDFLEEALDISEYLYVHLYDGEIRGFAAVYLEDKPDKHIYINLICNTKFHAMETRLNEGKERYSGKNIMNEIVKQAKRLKCKSIRLNAIKDVISYYFNIGFHFENINLQREIESEREYIQKLRSAQLHGDNDEVIRYLDRIVGRFYPGFYSEKMQRKIGEDEDNDDRKEIAMEDGIPMVYYLPMNGGKKKRRKSYKRRSSKSQHSSIRRK